MKKMLLASLIYSAALTACGGGGGTGNFSTTTTTEASKTTTEASKTTTEASKADVLAAISPRTVAIAPLPPAPDEQAAKSSISGVDANSNGIRDDIEISLAKAALHNGGTASSADFSKLIDVVKIIQPSETSKTIDMKKFYCSYQAMPTSIKEKISSSMMIALVTDTPARKKAYIEQSINTSGSLGAEICE